MMKTNKEIVTKIIEDMNLIFNNNTKVSKEALIECWSKYRNKEYEFYKYANAGSLSRVYKSIFKNINKQGKESWRSYILRINGYRICTTCSIISPISKFQKDSVSPSRLKINCNSCRSTEYSKYRKQNTEKESIRHSIYYKNNTEKVLKCNKLYNLKHPEIGNAITAKYRAAKLKRTPNWLTEEDHWMFKEIYSLATLREELTGVKWHVDHIIPLQGNLVCGLHVPTNLQVITATENMQKSNKYVV